MSNIEYFLIMKDRMKKYFITLCILTGLLLNTQPAKADWKNVNDFFKGLNNFNRINREAFSGKNNNHPIELNENISDVAITRNDFVGNIPAEALDIIDMINNKDLEDNLGAELTKGILLVGPPGTGKTSIARIIACETKAHCIQAKGSDFVNMYVGAGAANIRELFEKAQQKTPCIIIIDEIDAIGSRDNTSPWDTETRRTINALLAEMDGISARGDIIVIATTNHVDLVDSALRRPGRLDYIVHIGLPNEKQRNDILTHYLAKKPTEFNITHYHIATTTKGFSGADLKGIVDDAARIARRNKHKAISQQDLNTAHENAIARKK